eukprot:6312844-Pyramimonas_sp.AAC.1
MGLSTHLSMLIGLREQPPWGTNANLVDRGGDLPAWVPMRRLVRDHLRRGAQRARPCTPAGVGGSPAPAAGNQRALHLRILA